MNRHDLISGLFWLGVSAFVVMQSLKLGVGAFSNPEPGFLLFWSSLFLGILSIILVVRSMLGRSRQTRLLDSWIELKWWNVVLTVIILILYALFLDRVGFLLTMFCVMALLYLMGRIKPHVSIACAFVTVVLAYVIFHVALQVQLPRGFF